MSATLRLLQYNVNSILPLTLRIFHIPRLGPVAMFKCLANVHLETYQTHLGIKTHRASVHRSLETLTTKQR